MASRVNRNIEFVTNDAGDVVGYQRSPGRVIPLRASIAVPVSASRGLVFDDLESVLDINAAATLTIPTDTELGITADWRGSFVTLQTTAGAAAATPGAGVSAFVGTPQTAAQWVFQGYAHVGANLWKYV